MGNGTLKIIVSKEGNATIEVDGVADAKCLDITKPIEDMLGKPGTRTMKTEAYASGGNIEKELQR